jgi:hypothetical protein
LLCEGKGLITIGLCLGLLLLFCEGKGLITIGLCLGLLLLLCEGKGLITIGLCLGLLLLFCEGKGSCSFYFCYIVWIVDHHYLNTYYLFVYFVIGMPAHRRSDSHVFLLHHMAYTENTNKRKKSTTKLHNICCKRKKKKKKIIAYGIIRYSLPRLDWREVWGLII